MHFVFSVLCSPKRQWQICRCPHPPDASHTQTFNVCKAIIVINAGSSGNGSDGGSTSPLTRHTSHDVHYITYIVWVRAWWAGENAAVASTILYYKLNTRNTTCWMFWKYALWLCFTLEREKNCWPILSGSLSRWIALCSDHDSRFEWVSPMMMWVSYNFT